MLIVGFTFVCALFSFLVWGTAISTHLLFPENPQISDKDLEAWIAQLHAQSAHSTPLSAQEIVVGRRIYQQKLTVPYTYHAPYPMHDIPEAWIDDLYLRQN